jgi:nitrogen fixation/metabolism regulation signal transduction histidine kinase
MALGRRLGRILLALLSVLGVLLWVLGILLFSQSAENSDDFASNAVAIVAINAVGVTVLLALIGQRLVRLIRDYRRFVPGSRLQARVVSRVVVVAAIPLIILYMFSVTFIAWGIDEWFNVDIGQGLDEALELAETAIESRQADSRSDMLLVAERLATVDDRGLNEALADLGQRVEALELTLFTAANEMVATFSSDSAAGAPSGLSGEMLANLPFVGLEIRDDGNYFDEVHVAVPVERADGRSLILLGRFGIPERIYELSSAVDARHGQFATLEVVRTDIELSFAMTLSLVLLVAILATVYAAFFVAQRLILPIQQLMEGTRAVARGDYDARVPAAKRDEIGFLVNSFNDMTQRLAAARREAYDSEQRLEDERHKLEVILASLSTGVVSLESDMRIRTANQAAGAILGVDLEAHIGESLIDLSEGRPLLKEFLDATVSHLETGRTDWRDQISLRGEQGNRELVCACSELPKEGDYGEGYVLVFDDITALIQAQKEAAWGEVARRLAHEIKNPLTPIQLSAERVRRRYLTDGKGDLDLLDRATHTIIQQVDAMKGMVDAFSEYARAPDIELGELDLNELITEVTELYRHQLTPVEIRMELGETIPKVEADIGRLRQVMHNLMRNASEAIEGQHDAEIRVTTRLQDLADGPYVEIVVGDNGPGFASDIIDQAFLPYVTSKTGGTGLGLAIVRKLVEEHGGRISARNTKQRGAEVSILLPLSGAKQSAGSRAHHRRKRA